MKFEIDDDKSDLITNFKREQYKKAIDIQKTKIVPEHPDYITYKICWDSGYPYEGSMGGGFEYSFTPTSLGIVSKLTYHLTGQTLDLTNYDSW